MKVASKSAKRVFDAHLDYWTPHAELLTALAVVYAALLSFAPFSQAAKPTVDASKPRYLYAVNFICGTSDETFQEGVVTGVYSTAVNVVNPSAQTVTFEKSISRSLPFQKSGANVKFESGELAAGQALEVECNEIRGQLPLPMTAQFRTGFVNIISNSRLVVTAVYGARPRTGQVSASDILSIKPTIFPAVRPPTGATGLCRLIELSSALIEGRISEITSTYDPVIGPRENITFANVQTHFGNSVGANFVIRNMRGLLPEEPEKTYMESPHIPRFVRDGHYLIFLSKEAWFYSPVVFDGAHRVETVAGKEVLIDQQGHALNPLPTAAAYEPGEKINPDSKFSPRPITLKQLFKTSFDLDNPNAEQPLLPGIDASTVENAFNRTRYLDFVRRGMADCDEPFSGDVDPMPQRGRVWNLIGAEQLADPNLQPDNAVSCGSVDPTTGETRVCK